MSGILVWGSAWVSQSIQCTLQTTALTGLCSSLGQCSCLGQATCLDGLMVVDRGPVLLINHYKPSAKIVSTGAAKTIQPNNQRCNAFIARRMHYSSYRILLLLSLVEQSYETTYELGK